MIHLYYKKNVINLQGGHFISPSSTAIYPKGATGGAGVHAVMMWWDGLFSFVFLVFPCPSTCFPSLFRLDRLD